MAAGDGAQLPATVAASRSVEKALEEAAASGALNLSNRKLKEFPRSARNYDLSDITHAEKVLKFLGDVEKSQDTTWDMFIISVSLGFTSTLSKAAAADITAIHTGS
ncbi:leucine-rich repeat and calponin homology domain-containing protein 4 isoform X1 [Lates japonicus]|uniref:Leucine-rich repeat and calponin homology domain-containing protein 4 isoform X1 n=1 Tax=Lates japonicus TaxID=270547 RepID=A0AAD3N5L5_LATJO|nr:leucine-rich repeat and calponin homology domain-containing protein 4 isoform X1 [Lates japonicus]